jgi:hypothetical protein
MALVAWSHRRRRLLWIGIAVGLCLHFRDLAEEPENRVALFWPFSDRTYHYSHALFLVLIAVLIVANLIRPAIVGQDQPAAESAG